LKIYLAHNFAARDTLRSLIVPFLEQEGHEVTSRWITGDLVTYECNAELAAVHDLEDIERADTLILFTDQYGNKPGKGKFIELGYAIRAGKRIILVGDDLESCVFYHLPTIRKVRTIEVAIALC
jgi:nucleoside 2-deoxyribosyltransferase